MKTDLHPEYQMTEVSCASCGNTFETRSTHAAPIKVDICYNCHPFYSGKQQIVDTEGRVERFRNKYKRAQEAAAKK